MRAKVIFKFEGKVKLQLENGSIVILPPNQAHQLNPCIQLGDTGTLVQDTLRNRSRFILDAEDILFKTISRGMIVYKPT